jgi:hypothetical protein
VPGAPGRFTAIRSVAKAPIRTDASTMVPWPSGGLRREIGEQGPGYRSCVLFCARGPHG